MGGGLLEPPPIYPSRLWSDFQNSFVWWKLVKIVIDFYSISKFLSFTVWPLDVAEVTKVRRVNFFKKKIQNFQFLARNTLYTSNESWDHVEFKFIAKKYDLVEKNEKKKSFFSFLPRKRGRLVVFAGQFLDFLYKKFQKWLHQGLEEASTWKVTKGELWISAGLESAGDLLSDGLPEPPPPTWIGLEIQFF